MTSSSPPRRFNSRRPSGMASQSSRIVAARGELRARLQERHRHHVGRRLGHRRARQRQHAGEVVRRSGEAHDDALARPDPQRATGCRRSHGTWRAPRVSAPTAAPTAASRAPLAPPPAPRNAAATSIDARWNPNVSTCHRRCWSSPHASRAAPPASRDRCRTSRSREERRRPVVAAVRTGAGRGQAVRRQSELATMRRVRRACAPAPSRRRGAPLRRGRAPAGARGSEARPSPRPRASARSAGRLPPARATRDRTGSPSPRSSPRRSRAGCRRDRRRPTCPIAGTARTTAAACRSRPGRAGCPSRGRPPAAW